jgi:hypothetical protein
VQRETITEAQLRAWIVARVREDARCREFAEEFPILRLARRVPRDSTWDIGGLSMIEDWSPDCYAVFERTVDEAQQRFDLQ